MLLMKHQATRNIIPAQLPPGWEASPSPVLFTVPIFTSGWRERVKFLVEGDNTMTKLGPTDPQILSPTC